MEETFEEYLKQARQEFVKVANGYTVSQHLKLRTAIDSLLIAYDQATDQALTIPVVVGQSEQLCVECKIETTPMPNMMCEPCYKSTSN